MVKRHDTSNIPESTSVKSTGHLHRVITHLTWNTLPPTSCTHVLRSHHSMSVTDWAITTPPTPADPVSSELQPSDRGPLTWRYNTLLYIEVYGQIFGCEMLRLQNKLYVFLLSLWALHRLPLLGRLWLCVNIQRKARRPSSASQRWSHLLLLHLLKAELPPLTASAI